MLQSSVILDVAIVLIFALSVWIGAKKGLFRSLAELVVYLVGLVGANLAAGGLTDRVVDLLRPVLESQVSEAITDYISGTLSELPFGEALAGLENVGDLTGDAAAGMVDLMVETLLYNLTYVIVFLAVFLLLVLLLRLIINLGDFLLRLPVLHEMNTLGGILIGAVKGILFVCLILWLDSKTGLLLDSSAVQSSHIASLLMKILPA